MDGLPTEQVVRSLAKFRAARDGVLSLYLTFPPAGGKRRNARGAVMSALQSLAESEMSARQRANFERERERVEAFFGRRFSLSGRSVVLFSCGPRGLWEVFQLQVPSLSIARFGERPAVSQLAAILDERERYGILLLDKERARILSVFLGEIEDDIELTDGYPGRTSAGGWAQARYERHREAHLHAHIMRTVEALAREQRRRHFDRLLVGGPDGARTALLGALPRGLRTRVAGTFSCELFARDTEVLRRTARLIEAAEREGEEALLDHMMETARNHRLAMFGWDDVLPALYEGSVHKVVLVDGLRKRGAVCPNGHVATGPRMKSCPVCHTEMVSRSLTEAAVGAALDTQASVEMVRGNAARRLRTEGGICALLRY